MNVRLPKDCTDDDIFLGGDGHAMIGPQPTIMTFFLEKVRLAHLCREMADTLPLETYKLTKLPYEHIIALDKSWKIFFRTSHSSSDLMPKVANKAKHLRLYTLRFLIYDIASQQQPTARDASSTRDSSSASLGTRVTPTQDEHVWNQHVQSSRSTQISPNPPIHPDGTHGHSGPLHASRVGGLGHGFMLQPQRNR